MKTVRSEGPRPIVLGALCGTMFGAAHGLWLATQFDTDAPYVEAARGWFVGMVVMTVITLITKMSSMPAKTTPLGHFLSWSIGVQRFLVGAPLALVAMFAYCLAFMQRHPNMNAFALASLVIMAASFGIASITCGLLAKVHAEQTRRLASSTRADVESHNRTQPPPRRAFLDAGGRLITPHELLGSGELPPIG